MRGMRTELMVGIFTLLAVAILAFMTFRVADLRIGEPKGYKLYVFFDDTAGLEKNTRIKIAGVDAGKVENIELFAGRARVTLRIYEGVEIYSDATAWIKSTGLLGEKYLEIKSGAKPPVLTGGNVITDARETADIDELVRNITDLSVNIAGLVAELSKPEIKEALKESLLNIRDLTRQLKETVEFNRVPLENTVANLEEFTSTLRRDTPGLMADLRAAVAELKGILERTGPELESIAKKTDSVMESMDEITGKISRGEGSLGKLVHDDKLYDSVSSAASGLSNTVSRIDRFRTFVTFRGDYMEREVDGKGHFYLTLQPRKEKYYILGAVTDPVGRVKTTTTMIDGTAFTTETVERKLEFTAQIAHRFKDTAFRVGLFESTFGLGADQFLLGDKLIFSLDAWDFNEDEFRAKDPHVRLGADYFLYRTIFLTGGYDNFLNSRRGYYAGAGVKFEDEDLKYLFGSIPMP